MKRYKSSMPRAPFGLAAVAMTAITMGGLVVLPAKLDSISSDACTPEAGSAMGAPGSCLARIGVPVVVGLQATPTPVAPLPGSKVSEHSTRSATRPNVRL